MKKKIPEKIKPILKEVKTKLKEIYKSRLKKIILYGSFARGDDTDGSDIDLIILLKDMKDSINERKNYFDTIWKLDLKFDTLISIIPLKEEDFKERRLPIILNAKREGISV
jgi:predicted nucleotidyltransferase